MSILERGLFAAFASAWMAPRENVALRIPPPERAKAAESPGNFALPSQQERTNVRRSTSLPISSGILPGIADALEALEPGGSRVALADFRAPLAEAIGRPPRCLSGMFRLPLRAQRNHRCRREHFAGAATQLGARSRRLESWFDEGIDRPPGPIRQLNSSIIFRYGAPKSAAQSSYPICFPRYACNDRLRDEFGSAIRSVARDEHYPADGPLMQLLNRSANAMELASELSRPPHQARQSCWRRSRDQISKWVLPSSCSNRLA